MSEAATATPEVCPAVTLFSWALGTLLSSAKIRQHRSCRHFFAMALCGDTICQYEPCSKRFHPANKRQRFCGPNCRVYNNREQRNSMGDGYLSFDGQRSRVPRAGEVTRQTGWHKEENPPVIGEIWKERKA